MDDRRDEDQLSDDWLQVDEIPRLKAYAARLDDILASISVDLLLMGIYNVVFFMGAYLSFMRYDVK